MQNSSKKSAEVLENAQTQLRAAWLGKVDSTDVYDSKQGYDLM
jgi:hypothetical protein